MRKAVELTFCTILLSTSASLAYQSLQEVYENSEGMGVYDKYLCLDPDIEYLGDLEISDGVNVRIDGNGALIFGPDDDIAINVNEASLDISHCVVVGGSCGIYFGQGSSGNIFNNTVIGGFNYGIGVSYPDMERGVYVWDNIIVDSFFGFYCVEEYHPKYLGYNTVYNSGRYRYVEFCPG